MVNRWLFKRIDNSALIVFRLIFGLLIIAQSWGAILTGYVKNRVLAAKINFNFIGFDFVQPLPGNWMYLYFIIMGTFGIGVFLGYKYKYSVAGFTLMWTYLYLMEKTSYNNHYYLLILLCIFMWIVPANRYLSLDVKKNPALKRISMPRWVPLFIIAQMAIVYIFGAIAKLYPDWLDGTFATDLMASKAHYPIIGNILQTNWSIWSITYFGILFDFLIVPLMLWKRTRPYAFGFAVFFHLFNSAVFQIGIFPYLALGLFVFFFPPETIHRLFLKKRKAFYDKAGIQVPLSRNYLASFLGIWFLIQLFLPLRHYFIQDDVLWTEEGHRMSWRMMLRHRSGYSQFTVKNKTTGETIKVDKTKYLTQRQKNATATHPDMIWQFAHYLKDQYKAKGETVEVYVRAQVSINGKKSHLLVKPEVDLATADWNYFGHNNWIMPNPYDN